jgi:hypothetical protein
MITTHMDTTAFLVAAGGMVRPGGLVERPSR